MCKVHVEDLDKVLLLLCLQRTWAALPHAQDSTVGVTLAQEHQITGNRQPAHTAELLLLECSLHAHR